MDGSLAITLQAMDRARAPEIWIAAGAIARVFPKCGGLITHAVDYFDSRRAHAIHSDRSP